MHRSVPYGGRFNLFNINIRCIEIGYANKSGLLWFVFNINIRCIEISMGRKKCFTSSKFNINIRCIEMRLKL